MTAGNSSAGEPQDEISRSDIEALGATRSDLGADYEPALLDNFADKVEATIDARVSAELARRGGQQQAMGQYQFQDKHGHGMVPMHAGPPPVRGGGQQLALGIVSLVAFIPISIVLGLNAQLIPLVVTMFSIVAVNFAHYNLYKDKDEG